MIFAIILLVVGVSAKSNNDYYQRIYFPADDTNRLNKPSHNRVPVYDQIRCGRNEYLYPGDSSFDWTCDCKPGFIYFPGDGLCHEAYRRGPCKNGEILMMYSASGSYSGPKCVANQCFHEGLVVFNNQCQQLDSYTPCRYFEYLIGRKTYLTVNPSTFLLACMDVDQFYECNGFCCTSHTGRRDCFQKKN